MTHNNTNDHEEYRHQKLKADEKNFYSNFWSEFRYACLAIVIALAIGYSTLRFATGGW